MTNLDHLAKIHKMRDDRWTIRDKLTQFRGLINLYARDRKNLVSDTQKTRRKNYREIRTLKKDVQYYRETLTNAKSGDKQRLRNALQNHRPYLLAYEKRLPHQVAENVFQNNFTKTKLLDRIESKLRNSMEQLHQLQLEIALLQDRMKIEAADTNSPKFREQSIVNKIQNMEIKTNAASSIRFTYQRILDLLKKDALYFDRVLKFLHDDQRAQMKCVLRATEMGQLATEDVFNLRNEYKALEKEIKASIKMRDKQVRKMKQEVDTCFTECKMLTRTESETELNKSEEMGPTPSELALPLEIAKLEATIRKVQEVTLVSTFDEIFPQMQEQVRQKNRLIVQLNDVRSRHTEYTAKRSHGEMMLAKLQLTVGCDAMQYKDEKKKLLSDIGDAILLRETSQKETIRLGEHLITLRSSLQTLFTIMERVRDPNAEFEEDKLSLDQVSSAAMMPIVNEEDAEKLLEMVSDKLAHLTKQIFYELNEIQTSNAKANFAKDIISHQSQSMFDELDSYDQPLVVEHAMEDALVPTREAIKLRSSKITEQFLKPLEMRALPKVSKLKGKGKKKWL